MPEISVIIPTRDARDLLARTVRLALGQRGVDHEVVVVDDGSIDGTAEYLAGLDDPRLIVVSGHGGGVGAARNLGIEAASGEWLAFLDHDDLWAPDKLVGQLEAAREVDVGLVYSGVYAVDAELRVLDRQPPPPPETLARDVVAANPIPGGGSNPMARADLVRSLGGFDPDVKIFSDWDMWIRLADNASAAADHRWTVAYVEHAGGLSLQGWSSIQDDLAYVRAKYADLAERYQASPGSALAYWQWLEGVARRVPNRRLVAGLLARRGLRFRRPGDLVRAGAMLVGGERLMASSSRAANRIVSGRSPSPPEPPEWLSVIQRAASPGGADVTAARLR